MGRQNVLLLMLGALVIGGAVRLMLRGGGDDPGPQLSPRELEAQAMDETQPLIERQGAVAHLGTAGQRGVEGVRRVLAQSQEPAMRAQCLLVLSDAGDFESVEDMISGLTDPSPQVRAAADVALPRILGGLKIKVQAAPTGQTEAERRQQAEYYRNFWTVMKQSEDFAAFRAQRQGQQP